MTVYELMQKLAKHPADTKIVLASDWGELVLSEDYLCLPDEPCLAITNTPESKLRHSQALAERDEAVSAAALAAA